MRCTKAAGWALTTFAGLVAAFPAATALADPDPSAPPAAVEPQPMPATGEVDNQNPPAGGTVVVTGHGFQPQETVSFDATIDLANRSGARIEAGTHLAVARADAAGDASASIRLPAGFTGQLPIRLTGQASGVAVSAAVTVAAAELTRAAAPGLPVTGPGALGYTASGLAFVVGGAALIVIARLRRSAHVAAHASR